MIFLIFCMIFTMVSIVQHVLTRGIPFADHEWYWKECACTMKGIDSATAIRNGMYIESIGQMPENTATLPWAKLLGTLIHGAFLPYKESIIYFTFVNVLVISVTAIVVFYSLSQKGLNRKEAGAAVLALGSSWYLVDLVTQGNSGTLLCFLVILSICLVEKHEIICGVLMAFTMVKPQIAIPFFVIWLLMKKWRLIVTSVSIVLLSWGMSAWITHTAPLQQLYSVFSMSLSYNQSFWIYGMLNPLRWLGMNTTTVLLLSMFLGLVVEVALFIYLRNRRFDTIMTKSIFYVYAIPAIVSVIWCYKSQCDYNILLIVVLALVEEWYMYKEERSVKKLCALGFVVMILIMKPFSMLNALISLTGLFERERYIYLFLHLDLYFKTIVTFVWLNIISINHHNK